MTDEEHPRPPASRVDAWGRSEPQLRALARTLYAPVYRHWLRAEWEGLEHVPLEGGALLVGNHTGAIPSDAPVVMHGIETELLRPVYGLANLFRQLPVLGTLWSRAGGVPAHPDNAYRLLHDDHQLVLVFPEGTKATGKLARDRYQLRRFGRGGFVEIAIRAGGADRADGDRGRRGGDADPLEEPAGSRSCWGCPTSPSPPTSHVRPAPRLRAPAAGEVPHPRADRRSPSTSSPASPTTTRGMVMEQAERIRSLIQSEVDDLLRNRHSVWRG